MHVVLLLGDTKEHSRRRISGSAKFLPCQKFAGKITAAINAAYRKNFG